MPLKAMTSISRNILALLSFLAVALSLSAQVPTMLSYQGRLTSGGTNFDGPTQFKFAFVNGGGPDSIWSIDNSSSGGAEFAQSVPLTVTQGLFTVMLGDTSLSNMQPIPASVFAGSDVRLRIWV